MNKSRFITVVVGAGAMLALLLPATVASAGSIGSGPLTLTVKDSPFFIKGSQEGLYSYCNGPLFQVIETGNVRLGVSATSPYGIASWDVSEPPVVTSPPPWTHYAQSAPPVLSHQLDNFTDDCGGQGYPPNGWIIRVTDKHGNVAELEEDSRFSFGRWDNSAPGSNGPAGQFSYSAGWSVNSPCAQCDNGSTVYTTKVGASATFTLGGGGWTAAHLGLVMTKGPGHGAVKLYLDGVLKATVNTYSATWKYRNYVYDFGPLTAKAHTVKLVNVATAGRPRIDVQGMALVVGTTQVPPCDPDTCP